MAGHYFYDPRPFYGHTGYTGLVPLDELFYGRYESSIPYWMDQRMIMPFEENYYPGGQKQNMGSRRGSEVRQQQSIPQQGENNFMTYKRPELVRDDMYADMYRRSPYNFNYSYGRDSVAVMPIHPETMRRGQSHDDTWVHSMSAPASSGYGQAYRGLPEPPPGAMTTHFANGNGNGNGSEHYRNMHRGGDEYRPVTMNKQSNTNNHGNGNSHGNSLGNSHGNSLGNSHGNSHGNNHGTKQMGGPGNQNGNVGKSVANATSLKRTSSNNAKHYDSSSSSDSEDDDDDSHERGQRSSVKSQHGYNSHAYESKNSSHSPSSKKSGTQNGYSGAQKRNNQSKISKLLGFRDGESDDSLSSENESYGASKKRSSNNGNDTHGSNFQTQYAAQPKHSQGGSQSKSVELKVPICCDNCERKVRSCLEKMHGVEYVLCDQWKRKVVVSGKVKADDVLKRVRRVKKTSELWQQAKLPQTQTQTQQQPQQRQQRQQQGLY